MTTRKVRQIPGDKKGRSMKIVVLFLSILNGGYMLVDGIFVMINGKFIGPDRPGPWASIFSAAGIDVFKLGPMFVVFGVAWLVFVFSVITRQRWAYVFGIGVSIATLWYLPIGTIISVDILLALFFLRDRVLGN